MTPEKKRLSPEGELIETARERLGMSQNAAARDIGISGTRWRQIVKGQGSSEGTRVTVRGGADTVARMALHVGVTADQMEAAGRADVARKIADADPQPAPADCWTREITGPSAPLHEGEELRWHDLDDRRVVEFVVRGVSFRTDLALDDDPVEMIDRLRSTFLQRTSAVSAEVAGRIHTV